ncbi:MAG: glycosyltransferase family 1 protein [Sphingobacteriaceae bacterium]|nr:MAG: glycosyltransferase family 1 protein [Sphingobacteriaceae bacterium]
MADSSKLNASFRIGFDAKRAYLNKTGLGNYSRGVIEALAELFPENEYHLYTTRIGGEFGTHFFGLLKTVWVHLPKQNAFKSLWRSSGIVQDLLRDQIQLYHGLSQELPFGIKKSRIKTVVTIHDLIYLKYPEYFGLINRKIYEWKARYACKTADLVIAVSEQTKTDLIHNFNLNPHKIKVVYQSCDPIFRNLKNNKVKEALRVKYNLPQQFILNVGTIETRKNLLLAVKALKNIPAEVKLVVVGRETKYATLIKNYLVKEALHNRVLFLHHVLFEDLPVIYQLASVFVYPSRYEGFGIPILEALCSGTPVVAATGSCLEEAGGPGSFYVDPDDAVFMAEKINLILQNEVIQQKMKTKGLEYALRFQKENIAQNLINVYQQALNYA